MKISNLILRNDNGQLEIKLCSMPEWNDFDKIVSFLYNVYQVKTIEKYDGPEGTRRWVFECNEFQFELVYDDWFGNQLVSITKDSQEFLCKVSDDLETYSLEKK
jgi:hypothetical protein